MGNWRVKIMYGLNDLKKKIEFTDDEVICPVCSCVKIVKRQRNYFKIDDTFYCEKHKIYISASTFAYKDEKDNLLWLSDKDINYFREIKDVKRESRMKFNNSEDALTWNVFRYLDNNNLLDLYFSKALGRNINNIQVIYWSHSNESENKVFVPLKEARKTFEYGLGSEPDLILKADEVLILLEAKFGSTNNIQPQECKDTTIQKYYFSENRFWNSLFTKDFQTIAVQEQKYELARFWLLGSWMAEKFYKGVVDYFLINLTRDAEEKDIEDNFSPLINQNESRLFKRITWESIYYFILEYAKDNEDKQKIIDYFNNRTLGYNSQRKIKKAFNIKK